MMGARLGVFRESERLGRETPEHFLAREQVRAWALEAGFSEAGLVALPYGDEARDAERFEEWLRAGRAGTMQYLERRVKRGGWLRARVGIRSMGAVGGGVLCQLQQRAAAFD